ncbi:alpha-2-macroglobulin family protein [Oceanospirillum maris]|uniref:alpha-2-macroglobulin family protein n=1 Tax=Oceanospirillum maris TaxID=64977 RepID=UPI000401745F|nr:alpha-2-macroglobulin [Oceanospirillum maris]
MFSVCCAKANHEVHRSNHKVHRSSESLVLLAEERIKPAGVLIGRSRLALFFVVLFMAFSALYSVPVNASVDKSADGADRQALYKDLPLDVTHIGEVSYDDGNTVGIRFSVPLDGSQPFQSYVQVASQHSNWVLSDDGLFLYLLNPKPEMSYEVLVSEGLTAANGKILSKSYSKTIRLSPAPKIVRFLSDGHYLPLGSHAGLPVQSQNVPQANASFFRVDSREESLRTLLSWKRHSATEGYYRLNEIDELIELVYEARFELNPTENKLKTVNLPVQDIQALQEPGVYLVVMRDPNRFDNTLSVNWFSVTDLGVHVRRYQEAMDVYVHRLSDAKPVVGARVDLLTQNGEHNRWYTTTGMGKTHIPYQVEPYRQKALMVQEGDSFTLMPLNSSPLDLSRMGIGTRPFYEQELFIYSPRDLYRGGDTVTINGLLRNEDGQVFSSDHGLNNSISNTKLMLTLTRPDGQKVKNLSWESSGNGFYTFDYPLAADAKTGNWQVNVKGPDNQVWRYSFKVEDFMPERLKISWNPDNASSVQLADKPLSIKVLGEYLYGAPAANNRFEAAYQIKPSVHPIQQWPDFFFGQPNNQDWNQAFSRNNLRLAGDGTLTLNEPSVWQKTKIPLQAQITGSLYESGGRPVVRRYTQQLLPAPQLVGVRPLFDNKVASNSLAEFELIYTNAQGKLLAQSDLTVKVVNRTRKTYWRFSDSRGWYSTHTDQDITELTLPVSIASGDKAKIEVPVNWGQYRLEITDNSTGLVTKLPFETDYWWGDQPQNSAFPDQVALALDKAAYKAGDQIKLTVTPPSAGETLILVESDHLLWSKRISTPKEGRVIEIPVDKKWSRHDLYITALHLQPTDSKARITPTRAIGVMHLPLDRHERQLDVSAALPDKWLPNQTVSARLKIADSAGQPVKKAWVTLAAVDVGILSITRFEAPKPFEFFFDQRRYQVGHYDMYGDLIELNDEQKAGIAFGGDGGLTRGGDLARSEVQIVSLYSGRVEVVNGEAVIPLDLPDFNGRLRLMAVAFDDNRFGHMSEDITVAAPMVTQLSLPRFIASGDHSMVALDVTNLSGATQEITIAFSATGPVQLHGKALTQTLSLKDKEKRTFSYPFSVGSALANKGVLSNKDDASSVKGGRIEFNAKVTGIADYPIDRRWGLVSRQPYPVSTHAQSEALAPGETITLNPALLESVQPESLKIAAGISNTVPLDVHRHLNNLLHYPYGCLEQTISSTYPWLYALDTGTSSETFSPAYRQTALSAGIERIAKKQKSNGGFGMWSATDEYEQHWLTAYAGHFMSDAMDAGVSVDAGMLERTLKRLQDYTRGRGNLRERWSPEPDQYRFAYQAYAHYVLARHNRATLADIRQLAQSVGDTPSLSLVHLAMAAKLQGDKGLANQLLAQAKKEESWRYIGNYGSDIRDKAQQARLLAEQNLDGGYVQTLTRSVSTELKKRRYLSTQEQVSVFQLSNALNNKTGKLWQADLRLGDEIRTVRHDGAFYLTRTGDDLLKGASITNHSDGVLYTDFSVQSSPKTAPPASSQGGVTVSRRFMDVQGQPLPVRNGKIELQTGDRVLVSLVVQSDQFRSDLLLVDLLPAGLELENQNLGDSLKLNEINVDGRSLEAWVKDADIQHQEYRDDRFVTALTSGKDGRWGDDETTQIFYLARAVTPGRYQIPNTLVEDMYNPEVRAISDSPGLLVVSQPDDQ